MKELVVISGKGGTGKTSLVGCFAALAERAVLADCDVDASDLPVLLAPEPVREEAFTHGQRAVIDAAQCAGCGGCEAACRFGALVADAPAHPLASRSFRVDALACEGCGACREVCPCQAISLQPAAGGKWFVSRTRYGAMVHARLAPGGQNSGKLVSLVRQQARTAAAEAGCALVLIDGSPGIGCPVIASITGASLVLIVTEPTVSGAHDLGRVAELTRHFGIPALVCVNRWDLNPDLAAAIESSARAQGLGVAGRVRWDPAFTAAQVRQRPVVEEPDSPAAEDIRGVWEQLAERLGQVSLETRT